MGLEDYEDAKERDYKLHEDRISRGDISFHVDSNGVHNERDNLSELQAERQTKETKGAFKEDTRGEDNENYYAVENKENKVKPKKKKKLLWLNEESK